MNKILIHKIVSFILLIVCFVLFWKDSIVKEVTIYNIKFILGAEKLLIFTLFTYLLRPEKIEEYVMMILFAFISAVVAPSLLIPLFLILDLVVLKSEGRGRFLNWYVLFNSILFTLFSSYFISQTQEINLHQFHYLMLFLVCVTKWVLFAISRSKESKGIVDMMIFLPLLIMLPVTEIAYLDFLLPFILILILCNFILSFTYRTNQKEFAFKDSIFLFSLSVLISGNPKLAVLMLLISNYQFDQQDSYKSLIAKISTNSPLMKEIGLITNGLLFTLLFPIGISLYYGSIFANNNIFLMSMIIILVAQFIKIYLLDYSFDKSRATEWNQNKSIDIILLLSLYFFTGAWKFNNIESSSNIELIFFLVINLFVLLIPIVLVRMNKFSQFSNLISNWNVKFPVKNIEYRTYSKIDEKCLNESFELPITALRIKHTHVLVFMLMLITAIVILFLNKVSP
ncbi:putative membrane protein [Bacteriovorax sp. BSW11_IV]|uniref:hypothetical protein n=1 Tax=Bacteriovorax sp. BSW11_IV TaxID=1353529 RepID=UPI00038A1BEB|nr:hypothetical protein [Bacteriovorax sp. BSW11_IV]EQC47931.1 putative membrane protein [Bacteriovorax sp. BSW11_IV]